MRRPCAKSRPAIVISLIGCYRFARELQRGVGECQALSSIFFGRSRVPRSPKSSTPASARRSRPRGAHRSIAARLDGIDLDRLDDPEVWNRIPLLTKDELRTVPAQAFHDRFCIAPRASVVEYWRSGGVTGRPLFYPRSADDMKYALLTFKRGLTVVGATPEDCAHISFPLGIHPVAHLYARAAEDLGIGTVWAGSGNNTPSEMQLELIRELKPTIWCGMGSYGPAPRQPGGNQGYRPRRELGREDRSGGRAAVARQAREARAHVGRASVRPVRHDRGRAGLLRVGRARWAAPVVGPVLSSRSSTRRPACRWPKARPGSLVITPLVHQQRDAVPALGLGRRHQHEAAGNGPPPGRSSRSCGTRVAPSASSRYAGSTSIIPSSKI